MKKIFIIIQIMLVCNIVSCKKETNLDTAKKIITEWQGKEIQFPDGINLTSLGKDTTYIKSTPHTIFLYTDSSGCTTCKLEMYKWNMLIDEVTKKIPGKIDFFFCFHPKDIKDLTYILKRDGFSYPVFIDNEDSMNKLNKFPLKSEYQCFLLDRDNKVLCVGNPIDNAQVWKLYKKIVSEEK